MINGIVAGEKKSYKGHNPELMETCQTLREYAEYTDRVRRYAKEIRWKKQWSKRLPSAFRKESLRIF